MLCTTFAALTAALAVAAVGAFAGGPLVIVIAPAMVAMAMVSFVRPCQAVVVPGLVVSPGELTRANLVIGYCDSASVLLGPLTASALIAVGGTELAFVGDGGAGLRLSAIRRCRSSGSTPASSQPRMRTVRPARAR